MFQDAIIPFRKGLKEKAAFWADLMIVPSISAIIAGIKLANLSSDWIKLIEKRAMEFCTDSAFVINELSLKLFLI